MIQKCRSLIRAENVVNIVMNDDRTQHIEATVDSYQNGREQGLQICYIESDYDTAFFIAEHRNVDDVVVYVGKPQMQSLGEDAYRNSHFFHEDEEAAEFVIKELRAIQKKQLLARLNRRNEPKKKVAAQ